jgi:hypothetical protein
MRLGAFAFIVINNLATKPQEAFFGRQLNYFSFFTGKIVVAFTGLIWIFMRSLHPWPIFPANLAPPVIRSLSLQFILQELITSFELVDALHMSTPKRLSGDHLQKELTSISIEIEKFLLFSLENPFAQKGGVLDKLCFYSEILLQASHIGDQEILTILEEMRNSVLRTKSSLTMWKKKLPAQALDPLHHLLHLYSDLEQKLGRFFLALTPYLQQARSDENVLLYLIEHRHPLNSHLGPHVIEDLLHRFFPAGHSQLKAVICEGYTRRGFPSFFAKAEPLIDALEWDRACTPALQKP